MTDMIERVARALHKKQMAGKWELLPETVRATYLDDAIAAIKAMRDPTDEMKGVFNDYHKRIYNPVSTYRAEHTWNAMIDAALKGTEQ